MLPVEIPSLVGTTVVDFSPLLPGPLASATLARAGARVIKIEPPGGDPMRDYGPDGGSGDSFYSTLNAGKRVRWT
jgi:crotonobetainyl-CoA:carnitine CoA-transferase CaiB-like acyl-CoA transferase